MSKGNQTVQISPGQVKDLGSALLQSIPTELTEQQAQYWLEHRGELSKMVKASLLSMEFNAGFDMTVESWQDFYKEFFDLGLDLSSVVIPPMQSGFDRLLIIVKGVTIQQAYGACEKLFLCWEYTNEKLDEVVAQNDRTAKDGHYAVWVRDRIEADEELKNKSANDLSKAKVLTETLFERIIHELKFFQETGKHLDIDNITLCAGSRGRGGRVPHVSWVGDGFGVGWCRPGRAGGILRARQVVW